MPSMATRDLLLHFCLESLLVVIPWMTPRFASTILLSFVGSAVRNVQSYFRKMLVDKTQICFCISV